MPRGHNRFIDLAGHKYGRLLVISRAPNKGTRTRWNCKCDCGSDAVIEGSKMKNGHTQSCGCWRTEVCRSAKVHGEAVNGITPELGILRQIIGRCNCTTSKAYHYYGGRGIKVCERWRDVKNFIADMGRRPTVKHSIERRDNNGNYEPSNCYWATKKEQANNRRSNVILTLNGETLNMSQWSEKIGISYSVIHARITYGGWPVDKALTTPVLKSRYKQWRKTKN